MAEKVSSGDSGAGPPVDKGPAADKGPIDKSAKSESSVFVPTKLKDDYLERVAAAKTDAATSPGKAGKPDTKPTADAGGSGKEGSAAAVTQRMTSENYMELYRQQQEALKQGAATSDEALKKAAAAKKQAEVDARAAHIGSQIDAWQRTLGQDPDTDTRTRATIATLARELAAVKKG